ncbi:phage head-tail joining protein [Oceanicaulis sp.]|uniref:phage head-tail joining protein n=1 Tax=Oceanicaulis sp. TaxID=1924941 RepID=UPI003D286592
MSTRYSQADLDALNSAIATGARSVSYNGQRVDYRDLSEMKSVRDEMERELGVVKTKRRSRAVFARGL